MTRAVRIRKGSLAISVGLVAGAATWAMMTRNFESLSEYYWQQALPRSGGRNVVNVILVDFRGFDTFGEIMVLGVAALIIRSDQTTGLDESLACSLEGNDVGIGWMFDWVDDLFRRHGGTRFNP
jgi:multicomponent K+:H+ antiporter subunit A